MELLPSHEHPNTRAYKNNISCNALNFRQLLQPHSQPRRRPWRRPQQYNTSDRVVPQTSIAKDLMVAFFFQKLSLSVSCFIVTPSFNYQSTMIDLETHGWSEVQNCIHLPFSLVILMPILQGGLMNNNSFKENFHKP